MYCMIMKRRNIETTKLPRRAVKRNNKFAENVYGNTFVVTKFLIIWLVIMLADFILEFRFEYIWPAWLLVQSVYETFKYQGFIYSMFFVCIAITSDTICLLFIPVQGLFVLASAYVWIHYVWQTDKGLCIPTALMWLMIMCVELTVRINDVKTGQLHISLCQPFAAHCIGHPIVTLGIGFKSYIFYRIKLYTQWQVRKDNNFYYELLKQALPGELQHNHTLAITNKDKNDGSNHCNGYISSVISRKSQDKVHKSAAQDPSMQVAEEHNQSHSSSAVSLLSLTSPQKHAKEDSTSVSKPDNDSTPAASASMDREIRKRNSVQNKKSSADSSSTSAGQTWKNSNRNVSNESLTKVNKVIPNHNAPESIPNLSCAALSDKLPNASVLLPANGSIKSDLNIELVSTSSAMEQLESTIAKLKSELTSAQKFNDSSQNRIEMLTNAEHAARLELSSLRKDHDSLQTRVNTLLNVKEKDKINLSSLEKRLKSEIETRETVEKFLMDEKQRRTKGEENAAAVLSSRNKESAELLNNTIKEFEDKYKSLQKKLEGKEADCKNYENRIKEYQANEKSANTLMSAIDVMKEKNVLLEKSLSAETRLKLDLFSALGECKRQLEIAHAAIMRRENELTELKLSMSDFLSVMPEQRQICSSTPHYSANFLEQPGAVSLPHTNEMYCAVAHSPAPALIPTHPQVEQAGLQMVHLDPNAAVYTPNSSEV